MAILIRVENSDGVVGQCDAKCYNATDPRCSCVCGGENHGEGLTRALAHSAELAEAIRSRVHVAAVTVDPRSGQSVLPGILD